MWLLGLGKRRNAVTWWIRLLDYCSAKHLGYHYIQTQRDTGAVPQCLGRVNGEMTISAIR